MHEGASLMRFMVVNTDYPLFIEWLYRRHAGLERASFEQQQRVRDATLFGVADFYASNLRALGHEVLNVYANVEPMQRRWAQEHGVRVSPSLQWGVCLRSGVMPWVFRRASRSWLYEVLAAQVWHFRPDVLYCMCVETVGSEFLRSVQGGYRLAVGQHAAPLPRHDLSGYDLMLSSLPNQVEHFRRLGLKSELFRLGFERRVLEQVQACPKQHDVVFVGAVGGPHERGTLLLEALCQRFDVRVWGHGVERLRADSPIRRVWQGPAWGIEMYRVMRAAKVVLNRHIDLSGRYANNMRLYEATGIGSLLLTDAKDNLAQMFEPGKEVATYRDAMECAAAIELFLDEEEQREAIARAGQARTLREHTYELRMRELETIVGQHWRGGARLRGSVPVAQAAA